MQPGARDGHRPTTDGVGYIRTSTPNQKDIAMLYVFNSANRVQIAWNGVIPTQKSSPKPRSGALNSFIRTLSAG